MKCKQQFEDFLREHVNLNQTRVNRLEDSVIAVTNSLKKNLDGYRKYSTQGSYAHKTIIRPVRENDEFDADILIYIRDSAFDPNNFSTNYVDLVYGALERDSNYAGRVSRKSRCVTVNYAGDFSLDAVPAIEHNGEVFICNHSEQKYEPTDGDGYKQWLNEINRHVGNNNFRKATRLFKYLRDHKHNFSVKSILLTTLLGRMVEGYHYNSDDFCDLPTTVKTLSNRLNDYLQIHPLMPIVNNPAMPSENFNRHWDKRKYDNFKAKFSSYNNRINDAYDEEDRNKSIVMWRNIFGDEFGTDASERDSSEPSPEPSGVGSTPVKGITTVLPPLIAPATKPYGEI